jgi:bifunctional N-acetylglucosamine-1-phosphate-uridyltransferase/glucosamine-1-phosphate-acetyltransferase GlmU-like protein
MIEHTLTTLGALGVAETAVVVGHGAAAMRTVLSGRCKLPFQAVRSGTADAVLCAEETLRRYPHAFVLVGDSPLVKPASLRELHARHAQSGAAASFLTATFPTPYPYARVLRGGDGRVVGCVEERDASPEQRAIREYLTSHYLFRTAPLLAALERVPRHPATGERYLTDVLGVLLEGGQRVEAVAVADWRELVGLNTPADLRWAEGVIRAQARGAALLSGRGR